MSDREHSGHRVVARLRDGKLIKGFLKGPAPLPVSSQPDLDFAVGQQIDLVLSESDQEISLDLVNLKALFFVKTFEGNREYAELKFFDKSPPIRGLWVRVQFYDKECIEGTIENSIQHLIEPGILMRPPDPRSNNEILYVLKSSLINFRVLGVRLDY